MLDLDQMKTQWAEQDRKLEQSLRLNRQLLSEVRLSSGRSQLQRLLSFTIVHAIAWLACTIALGDFIYEHLSAPRFALAAAALDIYAIGFLGALIRQIVTITAIDYHQPVATIQKQLESVRILRIRTTQWAVLGGTIVWTPFLIVMLQAFFSVDAYRVFTTPWLVANLLFGLALIPLAIWTSKTFGARLARSPFLQRLMDDLAGRNLMAASAFLATVAALEEEE